MPASLLSALVPKLRSHFPDRPFTSALGDSPTLIFPCEHPDVGDVEIHEDGDELTVVLGNFTHTHFDCYEQNASEADRADSICASVIKLLDDLFADRIELYGSHAGSGGFRRRGEKDRGLLSKTLLGASSFVWSGPLKGAN